LDIMGYEAYASFLYKNTVMNGASDTLFGQASPSSGNYLGL